MTDQARIALDSTARVVRLTAGQLGTAIGCLLGVYVAGVEWDPIRKMLQVRVEGIAINTQNFLADGSEPPLLPEVDGKPDWSKMVH